MHKYESSGYRNNSARRNVKLVNKRDIVLWFGTALICLFLYSIRRGW